LDGSGAFIGINWQTFDCNLNARRSHLRSQHLLATCNIVVQDLDDFEIRFRVFDVSNQSLILVNEATKSNTPTSSKLHLLRFTFASP
jgi:hypothetical protein